MGFRKSLFGFNCDDVVEYIEGMHKEYADKELVLNEKIDEAEQDLNAAQAELAALKEEKLKTEEQLRQYTDKYEEIERLSQNIGKLYLVAQANAQSVMRSAEESRRESIDEVDRNLNSIEAAHRSLEELKARVEKTSADFSGEVEALLTSLTETKRSIEARTENAEEAEKESQAVFAALTNQ